MITRPATWKSPGCKVGMSTIRWVKPNHPGPIEGEIWQLIQMVEKDILDVNEGWEVVRPRVWDISREIIVSFQCFFHSPI